MSVELFLVRLFVLSTITSLITEAIKKMVKGSYPVDMVVLAVSLVVGGVGTMVYYLINSIPLNEINLIYCVLMAIATWLSAMLGYDKVVEAIRQIKR